MKTTLIAIALSSLSALSWADATAFAVPGGSTLTRAEVIAAISAPSAVRHHGDAVEFQLPQGSGLSRAEVLAEAQADRAKGSFFGDSATLRFAFDTARDEPKPSERMAAAERAITVR